MSTKILDYRAIPELQPAHGLWKQYQPAKARHAFKVRRFSEADRWQKQTRAALNQAIGFQNLPRVPFQPRIIEKVDKGDYLREKIVVRTSSDIALSFYLLLPKLSPPPWPVTLAFHGHGYGVKDIVGLWEDGRERDVPDGYHKDFAVALCRRGFAVAAPEISCFGERQTDFSYLNKTIGQSEPTTCTHAAMLAFHLGGSVVGLRVWDAKRLVDYLEKRPDLNISRLGAMGISGGGMHAFFSTCLDTRIKAAAISGYFCAFRNSIFSIQHCACNFVPGLRHFGEITDLVGLMAPRPVLIEAGSYDPIFPIKAVQDSVEKARKVYRLWKASAEIETDFFEGRHQINGKRAYDFLWEKLTK